MRLRSRRPIFGFNTQPPEGGWSKQQASEPKSKRFQHTAARRRLAGSKITLKLGYKVSTHSRPKAAGHNFGAKTSRSVSFNTQPPEGGWKNSFLFMSTSQGFNTQPPEGGWQFIAGGNAATDCFNTQPPEGGWTPSRAHRLGKFSFNTQPPEGGWQIDMAQMVGVELFQHTAARRRLGILSRKSTVFCMFQHTAARRRLAGDTEPTDKVKRFNTQPPEGGWRRPWHYL